jgi:hypothetical protein
MLVHLKNGYQLGVQKALLIRVRLHKFVSCEYGPGKSGLLKQLLQIAMSRPRRNLSTHIHSSYRQPTAPPI